MTTEHLCKARKYPLDVWDTWPSQQERNSNVDALRKPRKKSKPKKAETLYERVVKDDLLN